MQKTSPLLSVRKLGSSKHLVVEISQKELKLDEKQASADYCKQATKELVTNQLVSRTK